MSRWLPSSWFDCCAAWIYRTICVRFWKQFFSWRCYFSRVFELPDMISLWSSFFSSYQCFIFRTWKHSLGFLFYNSSNKTQIHTLLLPQRNSARWKLIHAFLNQQSRLCSVATRVIATTALDMNPWARLRFGPEGFRRGRTWKGGVKKPTSICLIVCETMQGTFQWKQARRHIPLSNWVPSRDPAPSRNTAHIQKPPALLQLKWLYIFLFATNLSFKSFVQCSPLRRRSETGRTLLCCCFMYFHVSSILIQFKLYLFPKFNVKSHI